MKVYAVLSYVSIYEDYQDLEEIFSTRESAEKYIEAICIKKHIDRDMFDIVEKEIKD